MPGQPEAAQLNCWREDQCVTDVDRHVGKATRLCLRYKPRARLCAEPVVERSDVLAARKLIAVLEEQPRRVAVLLGPSHVRRDHGVHAAGWVGRMRGERGKYRLLVVVDHRYQERGEDAFLGPEVVAAAAVAPASALREVDDP